MARLPEAAKQNSCACLVLGLPAVDSGLPAVDSDPFQCPSEHPDEIPRVNWVAVLFGYLRRLWDDRYMASECEKNFLERGISAPQKVLLWLLQTAVTIESKSDGFVLQLESVQKEITQQKSQCPQLHGNSSKTSHAFKAMGPSFPFCLKGF